MDAPFSLLPGFMASVVEKKCYSSCRLSVFTILSVSKVWSNLVYIMCYKSGNIGGDLNLAIRQSRTKLPY